MLGSYLIPRSMCSCTPNPKLPLEEKLSLRNSYSRTFNPRSKISSALGPLTVQWTAIFSLRRIPKDLTVYRALENTGCWPVNDSNTLAALVSLSPDSPTQMLRHNLRIFVSRIAFLALDSATIFNFTFCRNLNYNHVLLVRIITGKAPC